jgi:hypothetical protein
MNVRLSMVDQPVAQLVLNPSSRLSQPRVRFQLVKIWVTTIPPISFGNLRSRRSSPPTCRARNARLIPF